MKIGLMFTNAGAFAQPELLAHLATTADRCGIESMWTIEHVVIPQGFQTPYPYSRDGKLPGGDTGAILDPLVPLSFCAGMTAKLKFGTAVMILPQRHPIYVAKELATIDVMSGGRVMLGVGSGWLKEEFETLQIDFHSRGARTDEAIAAIRALWRDDPSTFEGKHFKLRQMRSFPKPLQKGGIPIHIGGHSPAAVRRAARLGDGFFPAPGNLNVLKDLFAKVREECAKIGRNPAAVELSAAGRLTPDLIKTFQDMGVARAMTIVPGADRESITRGLEKIGNELVPL
jgi:probable F420-dependent oxidoreductase